MALKRTPATANGLAAGTGLTEQFNLCFLYLYTGTPPATAAEALDMVAVHTEVVKISNNSTATGLTFDAPTDGVLSKAAAEVWSGVVATDGFAGASTTATPTFFRLCAAGDNGRLAANASTGYRIQGTVGGPSSGADLQLGVALLTEGNTQPIGAFGITIGSP